MTIDQISGLVNFLRLGCLLAMRDGVRGLKKDGKCFNSCYLDWKRNQ